MVITARAYVEMALMYEGLLLNVQDLLVLYKRLDNNISKWFEHFLEYGVVDEGHMARLNKAEIWSLYGSASGDERLSIQAIRATSKTNFRKIRLGIRVFARVTSDAVVTPRASNRHIPLSLCVRCLLVALFNDFVGFLVGWMVASFLAYVKKFCNPWLSPMRWMLRTVLLLRRISFP